MNDREQEGWSSYAAEQERHAETARSRDAHYDARNMLAAKTDRLEERLADMTREARLRAHVLWSLNEHLSEIASESATRLELLRLVVAYDNANQSDLPLPLLASIRDALAMPA